jgi:integrase
VGHRQLEAALLSLINVRTKRKARLSRRSIRHLAGFIRVALNKAYLLDLIAVNPMLKVELPSPEPSRARSLSLDEVKRLRRVCRGDWTGLLVELALATGCRRGELLALEWTDIDWRNRRLSITKSVEETKKGLRLKCPKSGRFRECTLPRSTAELLEKARKRSRHHLIFPDPAGRWLSPALVSQVMVRRLRKAGILNASMHSLRHTHATALLSRGLPIPAVSARLGHSDCNITLRTYSHAMPLDDQRLANEWDRLLRGMR